MDAEGVGDHFREVAEKLSGSELLEMEFSEQEIKVLRDIFSQNDKKSVDFDKKV